MQGIELSNFIDNLCSLRPNFLGVCSINTMPKNLLKRQFFFANIDLNTGIGSHWICVLKNDKNEIELFDSLGNTDLKIEWFLKHCPIKSKVRLIYNLTPVQSLFSNSCGKFVLYFIIKRMFNLDISFSKLINQIFDDNVDQNEIVVSSFLNNLTS